MTTFSASETDMSEPPTTLISAPVAPAVSTSSNGEFKAASTAVLALSSGSSDTPMPTIARPPEPMMVLRSLKSRLTRPGLVMISVMPLMERINTSSATLKALSRGSLGATSSSLSLGTSRTVSANLVSRLRPQSALSVRLRPSTENGMVTTASTRAPASDASLATKGAAPVPVPPPRPQVTKTMSAPEMCLRSSSSASLAASSPMWGSAPAPRPLVHRRPMSILWGA